MNTLSSIALKLSSKIILKKGKDPTNVGAVIALQSELSNLGYKLSPEALEVTKTLSSAQLTNLHKDLLSALSEMVGYHRSSYQPLFKTFPEGVPSNYLEDARLVSFFYNRFFLPYKGENEAEETSGFSRLDCGCLVEESLFDKDLYGACPVCQRQNQTYNKKNSPRRQNVLGATKLKTIGLTTETDVLESLKNLLKAKTSLSETHKECLELFFVNMKSRSEEILPEVFPFKENMAVVSALLMKTKVFAEEKIETWVKTSTDVLRIATAISQGDVSLATKTKYKLGNRERRLVMSLLNSVENAKEDMLRHRSKWLRLGEYLHLGAFKKSYPKAFEAMDELRNKHRQIPTFSKATERGVMIMKETGDAQFLLSHLKTRPGELARKLDLILRTTKNDSALKTLEQGITTVASPLLLKLSKYIGTRSEKTSRRHFFLKGPDGKLHTKNEDSREVLDMELADKAQNLLRSELRRRYSVDKTPLKNVYIDPSLKKILVPSALRSAAKALSTVERGSRIKLDETTTTLRAFLYWKQPTSSNIDVDLSAIGYDKSWKMKAQLSWTGLTALGAVHSGDVRSAPNGASEFIDIPIENFLKHKIRYVAFMVNSFTGQPFKTYECFAGVMERENPGSGEIFEPKTVQNKFDLATDSTASLSMIVDLKEREIIWCDINMGKGFGRGVSSDNSQVRTLGEVLLNLQNTNPSLYDLFELHAHARGAKVHTEKKEGVKYDLVVDMDKAKDIDDIIANWI